MNFKKILSLALAALLTATASAFCTVSADDEVTEHPDPLVIPYSKIQKGNVDKKERATVETVTDPEKGDVIKVAPIVDTSEAGAINIDGYSIGSLGIDLSYYKYILVEYKYVSENPDEFNLYINFMKNGDVLTGTAGMKSYETAEAGKWTTAAFNMGTAVKDKVTGEKGGMLQQLHFYPFGDKLAATSMKPTDYMLISSFTFTTENPNKDKLYNITFNAGNIPGMTGSVPADMQAKEGDIIKVPEITVSAETKEAKGWTVTFDESKLYKGGEEFVMPDTDVSFSISWKDNFVGEDVVVLDFPSYFNGICDKKDTAFTENAEYDGKQTVKVIPNTASETNSGINLDGWSYGGAKINVDHYATMILVYKYVSQAPVEGNPQINIMKSKYFSKATSMKSLDPIVANRWAAAAFDLTPAQENRLEADDPVITQMHVYPLGTVSRAYDMDANDEIYVSHIIAAKDPSISADYHTAFIKGYEDNTFKPEGSMSRAEACTIVTRLACGGDDRVPAHHETAFSDVTKNDWFYNYVSTCEYLGYLKGYTGEFLPNQNITRAEFAELVYNMGLLNAELYTKTFVDVDESHPKYNVIMAAAKSGLINGSKNGDGTYSFKPDDSITRAEVVKIINNAYGKKCSAEGIFSSVLGSTFTDIKDHWAYADIIDASKEHVCYIDSDNKEHWVMVVGEDAITEDFTPDYEAGEAKKAEIEKLLADRIAEIKATKDAYPEVKGTKYYVSPNGNDANDGKSPATAFKTAAKGFAAPKSGDAVLFERGGEYRITSQLSAKNGVTYGAYGEGAKPILNGNTLGDAAGEENWKLVAGTSNIWEYAKKTNDIGNIILDRKDTFEKIVPTIKDGVLLIEGKAFKKDDPNCFKANHSFVTVYGNISGDSPDLTGFTSTTYARCDEGNPGKLYSNIELATKNHTINGGASNCVYDNIAILFSGNHGVGGLGGTKNVTFTNCEVGWIGGCAQNYKSGSMTRFGNGIEVYGSCDGYYIDNCYVYQCYDAGITHQISSGGNNDCVEANVEYTNNVIEKCIYNIEYFMGKPDSAGVTRLMKNILIKGNLLAYSGAGWGMDPSRSAQIKGWEHYNCSENFLIEDNIFFMAEHFTVDMGANQASWMPLYKNNTYVLPYGHKFLKFGAGGATQSMFTGTAENFLKNNVAEEGYKIYYVKP